MERPPVPDPENGRESREHAEAETVRREFEYRSKDGEILGRAEIELEGPEVAMEFKTVKEGKDGMGRKLRSFVLRGEKDGMPTEIDVMALANQHDIEVLVANEHLQNYSYDDDAKRALVPPLETPLDVGVFLHELGHADQYHDARFDKLKPLYGRSKPMTTADTGKVSFAAMMDLLEAVGDAVPDAKKVLDHEALQQLRRLEDARNDALDRKSRAEKALLEQERLRSDEFQALIIDAIKERADLDALSAEIDGLAAEEARRPPPLRASAEVAKLVDRLTDIGIRFLEEYADDELDDRVVKLAEHHIPAETALPPRLLSETALTSAGQVKEVLKNAIFEINPGNADFAYDAEAEEMIVRTMVHAMNGRWTVALRLHVGVDEHDRYVRLRKGADAQVRHLEERTDGAYEEAQTAARAQQLLMESAVNMKAVAALPTRMMERDATRRALQHLRTVRQKTGVDLLAVHLVSPEALVATGHAPAEEGCVASTAEGVTAPAELSVEASVVSDLKNALATYGADKMRLRPPDDEKGTGFIPIAGHERPEKN